MPNWCSNHITIRGGNCEQIQEIANAMREGRFLNSIIPIPKEQENDWWNFCVNNWGTKWEVECHDVLVEDEGMQVSTYFDSAWAPPTGVAEALYQRGLEVTLYYHEGGMAFCGKWEDGVDDYHEYDGETSDTVRAAIGDELDDFFAISENMEEWEEEDDEDLTRWIKDGKDDSDKLELKAS